MVHILLYTDALTLCSFDVAPGHRLRLWPNINIESRPVFAGTLQITICRLLGNTLLTALIGYASQSRKIYICIWLVSDQVQIYTLYGFK